MYATVVIRFPSLAPQVNGPGFFVVPEINIFGDDAGGKGVGIFFLLRAQYVQVGRHRQYVKHGGFAVSADAASKAEAIARYIAQAEGNIGRFSQLGFQLWSDFHAGFYETPADF